MMGMMVFYEILEFERSHVVSEIYLGLLPRWLGTHSGIRGFVPLELAEFDELSSENGCICLCGKLEDGMIKYICNGLGMWIES